MKLSIIIPAYNEKNTVGQVVDTVGKVQLDGITREIIVVDDGSRDGTSEVLKKFGENKDIKIIKHKFNKGKGAAVQTGIKEATGSILLIQDADLEYNPNDIPRLIKPIISGKAQVVYGTRLKTKPVFFGKNKTPLLLHFFGNKVLSLITSLLYGSSVSDMETGYKALDKRVLNGIKLKARSFDFEPEITAKILKKRIRILELPIETKPRSYKEGKKINTVKDGTIALWTLLKYKFTN